MQRGGRVIDGQSGHSVHFYTSYDKINGGREQETVTNVASVIPEKDNFQTLLRLLRD